MKKLFRYTIEGIVQGVGFRPFTYQLALSHELFGYVLNNSLGVEIEIEGELEHLEAFNHDLSSKLPPLARIDCIKREENALQDYKSFEIRASNEQTVKQTLISPDMSICDDCLKELRNEKNFRYNYFFINCTNCGPRYSIIKTVPYDRVNTSMSKFKMCPVCEGEYKDPMNRRYHAQPISCPECGPEIFLKDMQGKLLAKNNEAIAKLADLIKKGHIVAMKGMGGFHLICDARHDKTVKELRRRKTRPTKPFAVMFKDINHIKRACYLSEEECNAITSQQRPIVLVKKIKTANIISEHVAPRIDRFGVFLPYTPLHVLLLDELNFPIIATSANRSGEPIIAKESDLIDSLSGVIDYYLDYNREIVNSSDDSLLQMIGDKQLMMRSSRGFTPTSFRYEAKTNKHILAVGAHQKNAIALYLNNQVIFSPYIGDLESVKSCKFFQRTIEVFKRLYNFDPTLIICDKHPTYFSTQWAKKQNVEVKQVQHHYAHILACMFEHKLDKKVLGVAWDGTGYGDDGTIWGGEFLLCDRFSYERVAFFEPFLLLGGDRSIKDIKRIALSMAFDIQEDLSNGFEAIADLFAKSELSILRQMHQKALNSPKCSSVGRLFDAVAVFSGICDKVTYDGESGLIIESLYDENIKECYDFYLDGNIIRYKHVFAQMLQDADAKVIASKFINALVKIFFEITNRYDLDIALGGGVFQNRTLLEKILKKATKNNIYFPHKLPINDSSIAIGQLYTYI